MKLFIDTETYSELDLRKAGTFKYAENCEILIIVWAIDNGEVHYWDRTLTKEFPEQLISDLERCTEIWAHNYMFDAAVLKYSGLLKLPLEKARCSMVRALSHGLPGSLDELCAVFKVSSEQAKIKDGRRLIQLFCKPRPKTSKIKRATRETHPEDWGRFISYAVNDIEAMRAVHKKLPTWNYPREPELSLWHLDQVINDRGILIDREHAEATLRAVERAKQRLSEQTVDMTDGRLQSTTQVQATIDYIMEEYGIHTDNLTKAGVKKLLELDIPGGLRVLLETRQQAGSSSTAKYQAMLNRASSDDRLRGTLQFCGASRTRRNAARGAQLQNLPSRGLLPKWLVEEGIELMKIDAEDLLFPNTMHLAVSAIRQTLIAPPGMKFCISDLSNIEGRKVAWYANEEWKLKAFREFDAGTGHDLYKLAYSRAFKTPVENVVKSQRDIGKVMELASGYQGGVGAYVNMAAAYNFDVEKLADDIFDTLPRAQVDEAYNFLDWTKSQKRPRYGLTDKAFMSVDVLKRLWRNAHPGVTKLWADLQNAAEATIRTKRPHDVGLLTFDMKGNWLRIRLASGRYLCYPYAAYSVEEGVTFYGVDQYTRKWSKQRTYSGRLLENVGQSSARDVLYDAMPRAENHGFSIVLHVHDELVAEAREELHVDDLSAIMAAGEPWTTGLPLAAAGHESARYCKE